MLPQAGLELFHGYRIGIQIDLSISPHRDRLGAGLGKGWRSAGLRQIHFDPLDSRRHRDDEDDQEGPGQIEKRRHVDLVKHLLFK